MGPMGLTRKLVQASKSARHLLTMCVRALDYVPPVDLTFGEYLRALITAELQRLRTSAKGDYNTTHANVVQINSAM